MKVVKAAVKAVIFREDEFLVLKQNWKDRIYWDFPGGKVKLGENPYDALKREVKEETKLNIEIGKPLGLFWFSTDDGNEVVCTTFICKIKGDENIELDNNNSKEDFDDYKWVRKDEFLSNDFRVENDSIKKVLDYL